MKTSRTLFFTAVFAFAAGCGPVGNSGQAANTPVEQKNPWDQFVEQILDDYFAANPPLGIKAGRHEFDGKLPDWSEEGLERDLMLMKNAHERVAQFKELGLDQSQRFERHYMLEALDREIFWREVADQPHTNPFWYADFMSPEIYMSRAYAPLEKRIKAYTTYVLNVPRAVGQIRANMRTPMPRTLIKIGRKTIGGLADVYEKDAPKVFEAVKNAQLQKEFSKANDDAIKAVREFDAWLGAQEPKATDNFAFGKEKFGAMLQETEDMGEDLANLESVAKKDLDRNTQALKNECAKFAPKQTLEQCAAKANASKPSGNSLVDAARDQLMMLRKFVQDKDLLTIPGNEVPTVAQSPPSGVHDIAYIDIPGPYETNVRSVYYVSLPDPTWPKEKQDAYMPGKGSLVFTSASEVYPGHFVQFLHAKQSQSKFGRVVIGYGSAAGWAHYCEEMMYEAGLGQGDPEMRIGQLLRALLQDIRFISALGLHTKGMTVEESRKMFIEKAFLDEDNALQQAERGTFDPAYLNYTMGRLMIRKLRDDWCAKRGGRNAWKQFHDTFLSYGGPPIMILREEMMGADDKGSLF